MPSRIGTTWNRMSTMAEGATRRSMKRSFSPKIRLGGRGTTAVVRSAVAIVLLSSCDAADGLGALRQNIRDVLLGPAHRPDQRVRVRLVSDWPAPEVVRVVDVLGLEQDAV